MKQSLGSKILIVPTPVWVVGTYDENGEPNVMTAAWGGVCCSQPPCLTVSLRRATYSHGAIVARKSFTINVPSEAQAAQADYFGMTSGRDVNKFKKTGLTPVGSELVDAPYILEFPLVAECRLVHTAELGLHTQFVGEIMDIKADVEALSEKGTPDIEKVRPFVYSPGSQQYYGLGSLLGKAFSIGKKAAAPTEKS